MPLCKIRGKYYEIAADTKAENANKKRSINVKRHFPVIYWGFVCLLLGVLAAIYFYVAEVRSELLPPNASVGGVDIGGLTVEEANIKLYDAFSDFYYVSLYDSFTQTELVFGENINLWFDYEAAVDAIYMQKSKSWVLDLSREYVSIAEAILRFDNDLLIQFTIDFVSQWNAVTEQPENAYIFLGDNRLRSQTKWKADCSTHSRFIIRCTRLPMGSMTP